MTAVVATKGRRTKTHVLKLRSGCGGRGGRKTKVLKLHSSCGDLGGGGEAGKDTRSTTKVRSECAV